MKKDSLKLIDRVIMVIFYLIFSPFVLLHIIGYCINKSTIFLFEKILSPIYNKLCIIIRGPIPNSTVHVKGPDDNYFKRVKRSEIWIQEI
jgi:hypothetical protein